MVKVFRWKPGENAAEARSAEGKAQLKELKSKLGETVIKEQRELMDEYKKRGVSQKPVTRTFRSI